MLAFNFTGKQLNVKEDITELLDGLSDDITDVVLQGNSLSVQVCKLIGEKLSLNVKSIDIHDCFTGRLKQDVPISIDHLLLNCQHLVSIDIRDNALSVLGALHLSQFIKESQLQEIKLTNTGIGIEGIKHISVGLNKYCVHHHDNPPLRLFECGRNRLESGSQFLFIELAKCINLETLKLHQNGIRPQFIKFMSVALKGKSTTGLKNLVHLDLQDNSFMFEGSEAFANELLPALQKLEYLNVGECLTKEKGGILIIKSLLNVVSLKTVDLTYNELNSKALQEIYNNKSFWESRKVLLNGNVFDPELEVACKIQDELDTDEWDDLEEPDSDEED